MKTKNPNMKIQNPTMIGILMMIGLTVLFGLLGKPTEMGIIVVAGSISLSFLNIDKIQRFKGAGFEAEMRRAVDEANATVVQLRELATISSEAILMHLIMMKLPRNFIAAEGLRLHEKIISNLQKLGVSDIQIQQAEQVWKKGIGYTYHSAIHRQITQKDNAQSDKIAEFINLRKSEECYAPPAAELRKFINDNDFQNPEVDELLTDYSEYESSGILRRPDIFLKL